MKRTAGYDAVFEFLSRINHSCQPNCVAPDWPAALPGRCAVDVVAVRRILPGDELVDSYVDVSQPKAARQKVLRDGAWGISECWCLACASPGDAFPSPEEVDRGAIAVDRLHVNFRRLCAAG
ncbi:hypothetical protein T484DRAFT_3567578 [Baffinella frigidus]|nr:hypothetical protein T484DRAFT_3567578 [Cryptophyta sp. CCMP2293]